MPIMSTAPLQRSAGHLFACCVSVYDRALLPLQWEPCGLPELASWAMVLYIMMANRHGAKCCNAQALNPEVGMALPLPCGGCLHTPYPLQYEHSELLAWEIGKPRPGPAGALCIPRCRPCPCSDQAMGCGSKVIHIPPPGCSVSRLISCTGMATSSTCMLLISGLAAQDLPVQCTQLLLCSAPLQLCSTGSDTLKGQEAATFASTPAGPPMRGASPNVKCENRRATAVSCMMRASDCPMHLRMHACKPAGLRVYLSTLEGSRWRWPVSSDIVLMCKLLSSGNRQGIHIRQMC